MKKFHPILFSTPMVQAILEGRKTMTRRTKGLECVNDEPDFYTWCNEVNQMDIPHKAIRYDENYYYEFTGKYNNSTSVITTCPYGKVGDILWVRETWQYTDSSLNMWPGYVYRATDPDWETYENWTWKPSIFMPKAACRIFLEITDIKVERLHDISEADAINEGIEKTFISDELRDCRWKNYINNGKGSFCEPSSSFESLWAYKDTNTLPLKTKLEPLAGKAPQSDGRKIKSLEFVGLLSCQNYHHGLLPFIHLE